MRHVSLAAVCLASLFLITGCEKEKAKASKKPEVVLTLRTTPKGAAVLIDGKRLTATTPLQHDLQDNDEHMIEINAKGYESKWFRIPPSERGKNMPYDLGEIKLTHERVPMILRSVPSGARVSMDGDDLGKTPVYLKWVSPGAHEAIFSFAGHAKMRKRIEIVKGEFKNVIVKLESITGTLTVLTKPTGADIFVQGQPKGPSDVDGRLVIDNVPEGVLSVEVRKEGFVSRKLTIDLKPSETKLVSVPALRPKPGTLRVESTPQGAKVYRNGLLLGTTPLIMDNLKPVQYTIKVVLKGYEAQTKIVKVIPNMTKAVAFAMNSMYGTLSVVTQPSECTVIVDGSTKGKTVPGDAPGTSKPLEIGKLKPGVHDLVFEKAGFESVKKRILVERGKNTRLPAIKLRKMWLPTHILRTKGEMKGKKVKLLSETPEHIDVEYQKGTIKLRVNRDKIEQFTPIK
jgi:hypothetical protein